MCNNKKRSKNAEDPVTIIFLSHKTYNFSEQIESDAMVWQCLIPPYSIIITKEAAGFNIDFNTFTYQNMEVTLGVTVSFVNLVLLDTNKQTDCRQTKHI